MSCNFGEFVLDATSRRLSRGGKTIHLSPKAFMLLQLLAAQRPRAVPKAELFDCLWPGTYVSEVNLPGLIAEIRRALNDQAKQPQFVRTIHGFGYAFCATARDVGAPVAQFEPLTDRTLDRSGQAPGTSWVVWQNGQAALTEGQHIVGRGRDAAIRVDDRSVSRCHARITIRGRTARLEDAGSKNGTYVNGERITSSVPLADEGQFTVGPVTLTFRHSPASDSTQTQAASAELAPSAHTHSLINR